MDPIMVAVLFKGTGMLVAIGGGILVARYGFHLYKDGVGSGRDRAAFEVGPLKMKAHSVGSVVMASAFLWAWAGVALSPNLMKKGDEWNVSSFKTPEMNIEGLAVTAPLFKPNEEIKKNPDELKRTFGFALTNAVAFKGEKVFLLNGKPATYDPQSIRTLKSETGEYFLTADIKTEDKTAVLAFEPKVQKDQVVFVPIGFGKAIAQEQK